MTQILIAVVMTVSVGQVARKPMVETSDHFYGQSRGKVLVYGRTAGKKQSTYLVAVNSVFRPRRTEYSKFAPQRIRRIVPEKRGFALRVVSPERLKTFWAYPLNWMGSWQGYEVHKWGVLQNVYNGRSLKPVLVLPKRVRIGDTWKNTFEYGLVKTVVSHEVLAINQSITVPAGTYNSIVVQNLMVFQDGKTLTVTRYFGKGVGLVKEVIQGDNPAVMELQAIKSISELLTEQAAQKPDGK